ncbi:MAG TPA: NADH-quinone oxidoreductase subunit L [Armatimonadota bacterium]|jgi:NADH-quinone oxidoreductase subunit L
MLEYSYWIAILPALALPINLGRKWKEPLPALIGLLLIGIAWAWSVAIFATTLHAAPYSASAVWAPAAIPLKIGFQIDHLTTLMLLVVTTVSLLVQLYSIGYMHGDPEFNRFYAFLGLFTAAMLGLVISDNWMLLMIAWELVGVSSYLLIGFWYRKPSAMRAAKKAFVVTRLADLGMLVGVLILWNTFHTLNFAEVRAQLDPANAAMIAACGAAAIGLFIGAAGKSAQFPLHVWLPDAMEGPTPVSALIHAATMVAAGVYLVGRSFFLFEYGSLHTFHVLGIGITALGLVRFLGVITLFMAATIAMAQNDIKKVLAYSTVSQLGYMMMGIGVGAWVAGLFHLMTHACFKALLFLGSGSVIHGTGTQDMREMGGLRKTMPKTWITYVIGYLALAGFPLFAGFWSKDAILDGAHVIGKFGPAWYLWVGVGSAFLTAFYMTRQMVMVFGGPKDGARNPSLHVHESPWTMWLPLAALAVPSLLIGFVGMPSHNLFRDYLSEPAAQVRAGSEPAALPAYLSEEALQQPGVDPAVKAIHAEEAEAGTLLPGGLNPTVTTSATAAGLLGLLLGWFYFEAARKRSAVMAKDTAQRLGLAHAAHAGAHGHGDAPAVDGAGFWNEPLPGLISRPVFRFLEDKWYIDEFYMATLVKGTFIVSAICAWFDRNVIDRIVNGVGGLGLVLAQVGRGLDRYVVDGIVNGLGAVADRSGRWLRQLQTGRVQNYAVVLYLGALLLVMAGLYKIPHH